MAATTLTGDDGHFGAARRAGGCVAFTVRRYNRHVVGFSGIRARMLEKLRDAGRLLPADTKCALHTVPAACARCRRSLTLTPAVSCLPCGHSCLCTDCDQLFANVCFECKSAVQFKLRFIK
ncbi:unknown [Orgyia pseudotsugata multiple nucleopolyhedrovirus]|uniref:Uncharacterized 13.0 kDa protein n=1 Tax=Orgyia pseudotsugata multicapsid polyhedrosis virus TaxID=262177 RepID=Y044_NPVOP|nr:hypothetical protein OpmnVgp049 [Orgyia pseudotsugata multiple nucleopolyhedrovirus]O10304.1 RecName: Full=Uncharacterized 13.0 kDa protein [Orgyia pseudotsugata multiple nucleopolyhedrovirus]pir/T10318/ hypothetical protein 49 - Orgyia pseudotsugata nuclear polyhedrosis virus [Orgyia pseudotsugata single capsid nuclopolyhedrovirus]AAC59048.1 unknown [Orgyia pseudotsugata multiple nucleopolyhedrovirus]